MRELVLLTGGCRSGKSARALAIGESQLGPRVFIATCPRIDGEMDERIARHRQEREAGGWETVECERNLPKALASMAEKPVILIDCLALWINNLIFHAGKTMPTEDDIRRHCEQVIASISQQEGLLILVTNEVGMGIVPENRLSRRYRDLLGRCNQVFAGAADRVELLVAGIPMTVKSQGFSR